MTIPCPSCHTPNPAGAKFCAACGCSLPVAPPPQPQPQAPPGGWQQPGWQQPGWQQPGWQQPGWQQPGWQQPGAWPPPPVAPVGPVPGQAAPGGAPAGYAPVPAQPSVAERQQVGVAQGLNPFSETLGRPSDLGAAQERPGRDPEAVPEGAPRWLAGFLVNQAGAGAFWPVFQGRNRVGRLDSGDQLDIAIDDPTTSSEHAVILASARPGRLKLEDIGSTNGTYLNGTHLPAGSRRELRDGDILLFGGFEVTVKIV